MWGAVSEMQSALRGQMPGLAASLSEKLDGPASGGSDDAPQPPPLLTWMETYHFNGHASDGAWQRFETTLTERALQLPKGIDGPRHIERFARLSTPCLTPSPETPSALDASPRKD